MIRWREEYSPKNQQDQWDPRFVESLQMLDRIIYFMDVFIEMDGDKREEFVKSLMERGLIRKLEARLVRIGEEDGCNDDLPKAG